ncbi:MAG: preprotein translocase subunit SecG [Bdellovibrionales bacterium]|nr:preprotein translocase subunit SecG [Bdellovibrionales bacterium]
MLTFLSIIHILMALILIVLVLLQDSKGGAMGMLSGGASGSSVFGSTGAGNFLVKATRYVAIIFAATSITLAYITSHKGESVLDKLNTPAATATEELQNTMAPVKQKEAVEPSSEKDQQPEPTKEK